MKFGASSPTWTGLGRDCNSASCPEFKPDFVQESAIRERINVVVSIIFILIQTNALDVHNNETPWRLKAATVLQSNLTRKPVRPSIGNSNSQLFVSMQEGTLCAGPTLRERFSFICPQPQLRSVNYPEQNPPALLSLIMRHCDGYVRARA